MPRNAVVDMAFPYLVVLDYESDLAEEYDWVEDLGLANNVTRPNAPSISEYDCMFFMEMRGEDPHYVCVFSDPSIATAFKLMFG